LIWAGEHYGWFKLKWGVIWTGLGDLFQLLNIWLFFSAWKISVLVCPNLWFSPNMLLLVRLPELQRKEMKKTTNISQKEEGGDCIILFLVLFVSECHSTSWLRSTSLNFNYVFESFISTISLKHCCQYIKFFLEQGLTVANISATTFPQTLDWLHGYLLQVKFSNQLCVSEMRWPPNMLFTWKIGCLGDQLPVPRLYCCCPPTSARNLKSCCPWVWGSWFTASLSSE
jgi:hypothetical protein